MRRTRNPEIGCNEFSDVQLHILVRGFATPRNDGSGGVLKRRKRIGKAPETGQPTAPAIADVRFGLR